jgi:hypothetical protein
MKLLQLGPGAAVAFVVLAVAIVPAQAASLLMSIGIRETGNPNNLLVGANGGATGTIEFVRQDGQTLTADGTWQRFAFTPLTDPLTAFTGNGILDNDWGVLEHIRVANVVDGATRFRVWIDDIDNTIQSSGPINFANFESATLGTEVVFQEPRFSSTTTGNLQNLPNASLVTNTMAHTGTQSNQIDFAFLTDGPAPANWLRLTTSGTPNQPNPLVRLRESVAGAPAVATTISFWAKAVVIPEPTSLMLIAAGLFASLLARCRRRD